MSSQQPAEDYEIVESWNPESLEAELEIAARGRCEQCDSKLVEAPSDEVARLACPSCQLVLGLVVMYPTLKGEGEPGEATEWPSSGRLTDASEDTDATWTYEYAFRATHNGNDLVLNEADAQFGSPPEACCEECGAQFGYAVEANIISEREADE